jgi:MoaA/NifB/PqqE/SkfB family radical SAM enzyme
MFGLSAPELEHLEMYVKQTLSVLKKHKQRSTLPAVAPWLKTYFGIQGKDPHDIDKRWFTRIAKNFRCKPVYTRLFIQYDGGVVPCAMVPPVCSVRERPLKEAVDILVGIRKRFEGGEFLPDCYKCSCALPSNYVFSLACSPLANFGKVSRYVMRSIG